MARRQSGAPKNQGRSLGRACNAEEGSTLLREASSSSNNSRDKFALFEAMVEPIGRQSVRGWPWLSLVDLVDGEYGSRR